MPQPSYQLLIRIHIMILACFSFGFIVETLESIREHENEVRRWQKQIKKTYDLKALRIFLDDQLKAHPSVDGIDLSKAKVTERWIVGEGTLSCGNWVLVIPDSQSGKFTIYWTYEVIPHTDGYGGIWKSVNFVCRHKSKASYELISATRTEDEYITLSP